jgi:hypothetical protein
VPGFHLVLRGSLTACPLCHRTLGRSALARVLTPHAFLAKPVERDRPIAALRQALSR